MAPGKRKRNERGSVDSVDGQRPSPHRPAQSNMARDAINRQGPDRRANGGSRGGRGGGRMDRRETSNNVNSIPIPARSTPQPMTPTPTTPGPMTPPPPPRVVITPTPAPQMVVEQPPRPVKPPPAPYDYTYLTEYNMSSWAANGRQSVIAAGIKARENADILELAALFQELIRATLDSRIDGVEAGNCVREILGPDTASDEETPSSADPKTLFLDSLSLIAETETYDPALRELAVATGISPILMRQQFDASLLEHLGLTRSTFFKVGIRKVTNLLYRQANYNLLREETEGYSKLITELFTASDSEPPSKQAVEDTFERVKGLIGTFDLDVGRVLDVLLDVFAAVLIKRNRYFIKLLRISSWWPREKNYDGVTIANEQIGGLPKWAFPETEGWSTTAEEEQVLAKQREERDKEFWDRARATGIDAFFELGGRRVMDTDSITMPSTTDGDDNAETYRDWVKATGTLPPTGNRTAAQLLGFKLRFYASDARDAEDALPPTLIYLAAVLIKIRFISLPDLYPHLYPLDENMEALREEKMKELAEKERASRPGGGAKNALMMAGALADDTVPPVRSREPDRSSGASKPDASAATTPAEVDDKDKLPTPDEQKVQLLKSLLIIGAIPESLFILGRFPWLPEAYPELLELIHRLLHHSLDKVNKASQPASVDVTSCPPMQIPDYDQSGVAKGQVKRSDNLPKKSLRWPHPDMQDHGDNATNYRFYWDEWADNVPVCQNIDDVFTLCSTLLNYSGVNIGRDASLLSKLASIGTHSLASDRSESNLARWQDLLKRLLVPALSLTKANTSVVNEVFELLRYYPAPVRYTIYSEWFEGQTSRLPAMKSAFESARLETIATMKRISKTNITLMARTLSKTAFSSPGVVFRVAIQHMEAYNNLIEVVVECAKYFTDLGYDVLIWSLISSLGGNNRSRTQEGGLLASRWLQALASFSGKIFKRYSILDPTPVLRYVNDQLSKGNSTDLRVLEELIMQMAGVVPDTDFNEAQLSAMTGGQVLQRQTLINLQDKRFESTKTAKRLLRSLVEKNLAGQLLLSLAQQRQAGVFAVPDDDAHIKFLASMIDDLQRVLTQYLDLLRSNLSISEFDELIPNITELISEFGLDPSFAFQISRPGLAHRLAAIRLPKIEASPIQGGQTDNSKTDNDGDVSMEASDADVKTEDTKPNGDAQVEMVLDNDQDTENIITTDNPWAEILDPIKSTVQAALPEDVWKSLSVDFYVTFWQLSLSDIQLPSKSYEAEISRLMKEQADLMRDRSDMTRAGMTRKEEAKKHFAEVADKLRAELKQQIDTFEVTSARLAKEKMLWFADFHGRWDTLNNAILEHCIIPRALLSPSDAHYAARMIKYLHASGTPHFRTAGLLGKLFRAQKLRLIIFMCTTREAQSFGRFLKEVLKDLSRWHADKAVFEKEAHGPKADLPGFSKLLDISSKPKTLFPYEGFREMLFKFHQALNTALRACLLSMEWTHIRNAITILKAVHEYFPAIDFQGKYFYQAAVNIGKREADGQPNCRPDLSLAANALLADLKRQEKNWMMKQAFCINTDDSTGVNGQKPALPQSAKTTLKPTAPEFKPRSTTPLNGTVGAASGIVEDGEVNDQKKDNANSQTDAKLASAVQSGSSTPIAKPGTPQPRNDSRDVGNRQEPSFRDGFPARGLAHMQSRPDLGRNAASNSMLDRPSHQLPGRPDAPFPPRHNDRMGQQRPIDRWDGRADRMMETGRLGRPGDDIRDRARDYNDPHGRMPELGPRGIDRGLVDRGPRQDHDHRDPPRRWNEGNLPDSRDTPRGMERDRAPLNGGRGVDHGLERLPRDNIMPPPRVAGGLHPDRASIVDDRAEPLHPSRAALISGDGRDLSNGPPRHNRDDIRDRDRINSRPQSPRRAGDRNSSANFEPRRDDNTASGRNTPMDMHPSRMRPDDITPSGPRSDRPVDRTRDGAAAFQPTQASPRMQDPDHGRLNNPSSRSQIDANFGRLNPAPSQPEIPSGPRTRGGRGDRVPSGPHSQQEPVSQVNQQPPTGPSNARGNQRRNGPGRNENMATGVNATVASTPSTTTPVAVHPDRLRHLTDNIPSHQGSREQQAGQSPTVAVHPDRARHLGQDQSPARPAVQTSSIRGGPPMPSPVGSAPPSGPRGGNNAQSPGAPIHNSTPTGPSSGMDRRRGPRHNAISGINNVLTQAVQSNSPDRGSSNGMNIRGRSDRMGSSNGPSGRDSRPSTPAPPPGRPELPRQEPTHTREHINPEKDLINPARASLIDTRQEIINPARADLITGRGPVPDTEGPRDGRDRRSRRQRSSRSRSPNMENPRRRPDDERSSRNHGERRGGSERDSRRSTREGGGSRDPMARGEREGGRRDGREPKDGPREARGEEGEERGGRRGERRDRERDESGRKRRSDEGVDRGHEKRPRR